jgi:hypothetical protein
MTEHKNNDAELFLFLAGLLIALAIIILPFIWASAREELSKPKVSVLVPQDCKAGSPCQICSQDGNKKTCTDGVCDAKANCIIPSQNTPALKYPIKGLAASVK